MAGNARQRGIWIGLVAVALLTGPTASANDGVLPPSTNRTFNGDVETDLATVLIVGLRAGLPQERVYLKRVAQSAEAGQIPVDLVRTTFAWARKKDRYQTRYFERALKKRANALGIRVPLIGDYIPGQEVPINGQ